jgi:ankyrin repeat protein
MNTVTVVPIAAMNKSRPSTTSAIGMKSHNFYLFEASKRGLINKMDICHRKGADVNSQNAQGVSPLWEAARHGQTAAVERLIELSGGLDLRAPNGFTPVNIATRFGHIDTVRVLCDAGANQYIQDENGCTPLWNASRYNQVDILLLLQKNGGNVNTPDLNGRSPCWVAARFGFLGGLTQLVELKADAAAPDKDGLTPLHVASQFGQTNIVLYLCEHYGYGNVDLLDSQGRSPLWMAAWQGHSDVIELLAGAGAVIHRHNNEGVNPFYAASKEGHKSAAETIRKLEDIRYLWEKEPPSGVYVNPQRQELYKEHNDKRSHRNNEFMNSNAVAVVLKEVD